MNNKQTKTIHGNTGTPIGDKLLGVKSVNGQTGEVKLTSKDVGALSQGELQSGVNLALQQAKESGEFNGNDYVLTESDKQDIADIVANEVLGVIENGSY